MHRSDSARKVREVASRAQENRFDTRHGSETEPGTDQVTLGRADQRVISTFSVVGTNVYPVCIIKMNGHAGERIGQGSNEVGQVQTVKVLRVVPTRAIHRSEHPVALQDVDVQHLRALSTRSVFQRDGNHVTLCRGGRRVIDDALAIETRKGDTCAIGADRGDDVLASLDTVDRSRQALFKGRQVEGFLHVQRHRRLVGFAEGIGNFVGEAVRAGEFGIRRVVKAAIRVQGQGAVGHVRDQRDGERITIDIAVRAAAIVGQDARTGQRPVLGERDEVVLRDRGGVHEFGETDRPIGKFEEFDIADEVCAVGGVTARVGDRD